MSHNIMVDLETFGVRKDACVVSIGAVVFDLSAPFSLGNTFHVAIDVADQQRVGKRMDASTVQWWLEQSDTARLALAAKMRDAQSTPAGLLAFSEFVLYHGTDNKIWAKGANFDIALLESLYEAYELPKPWKYNNTRCTRHAGDFMAPEDNPAPGTAHDALSDAIYQAQQLQNLYKRKGWGA